MTPRRLAIPILSLTVLLTTPAARAHTLLILDGDITRTDDTLHLTLDPSEHDLRHLDFDPANLPARLADALATLDDAGTPLHWEPVESATSDTTARLSLTPPPGATILTLFLDPARSLTPIRHQIQLRVHPDAPGAQSTRTLRLTSGGNTENLDLLHHLADPAAHQPRFTDAPFDRILVIMDATTSPPSIEIHLPVSQGWFGEPGERAPRRAVLPSDMDFLGANAAFKADMYLEVTADGLRIEDLKSTPVLLHPRASRAADSPAPHPGPACILTARVALRLDFDLPPGTRSLSIERRPLGWALPRLDAVALLPDQPPHRAILTNLDNQLTILFENGAPTACLVGAAPTPDAPEPAP